MKKFTFLFIALLSLANANAQTVTTLAGSTQGFADGEGLTAQFNFPSGVAITGGNIYIADKDNYKIRKITETGEVSTLAGSIQGFADGIGASAMFNFIRSIVADASGNLYVADSGNHKIRKITQDGVVTTLAGSTQGSSDGTGASAQFNYPMGVAIDGSNNIYVADYFNQKIRKITSSGDVSTLAGSYIGFVDGTSASAQFKYPSGVAIDAIGNVYVADSGNHKIRKISQIGVVTTVAGSTWGFTDALGTAAQFKYPNSVSFDGNGDLLVCDTGNHKIRKINLSTGVVTTLIGSVDGYQDGTGISVKFSNPYALAIDASGIIYLADYGNHKIRKIDAASLGVSQNIFNNTISVYPNPAYDFVNIKYNLKNSAPITMKLTNLQGQLVYESKSDKTSGFNSDKINLENQAAGVYFLTIASDENSQTIKIIKN